MPATSAGMTSQLRRAVVSLFWYAGEPHAPAATLASGEIGRIVAERVHAVAAQGEAGLQREPRLRGGPRLLQLAAQRQRLGEMEMGQRKVAVGLDAPA